MKEFPVPVVTYYATASRKRAVCITITRVYDGLVVRGTSWDENLPIGGQIYYSTSGGAVSDLESAAALNVDNAEILANFDAITAEDLKAGLWNDAAVQLFVINPDDTDDSPSVDYRDVMIEGTFGQITVERLSFVAEIRSWLQRLQQAFGDLVSNACTYNLGDDDCTVDLDFSSPSLRKTGTVDGVTDDGLTWRDSARIESGPAGGIAIVDITSDGEEAEIETATAHGMLEGDTVTLSDLDGPVQLAGPWTIHEPTDTTFRIWKDISDTGLFPAFVSGTATPLGDESGYWDYGTMEITGGGPDDSNHGIVRRIKSYVTGEWTLQRAFPFTVDGTETYELTPGCDKLHSTCIDKFDNEINFGGEPFVPGNDRMVQVGRQ